jgi:hypothetical protein
MLFRAGGSDGSEGAAAAGGVRQEGQSADQVNRKQLLEELDKKDNQLIR